jgi:hypothetical protein
MYPLLFIEGMRLQYRRTGDGRIAIYKFAGIDQDGSERWERKCTPIGVAAQLRMAESENAYGLRVVIEDMDGQPHALDFDRADLARMAAVDIRTRFFAAGLRSRSSRTDRRGYSLAQHQQADRADPGYGQKGIF